MAMSAISTAKKIRGGDRRKPPPQPSPACGGGRPPYSGSRSLTRKRGRAGVGASGAATSQLLTRVHGQRADRGAAGGLRFVHVLGNEGGIFELARRHRAHDIGQREVAGVFAE